MIFCDIYIPYGTRGAFRRSISVLLAGNGAHAGNGATRRREMGRRAVVYPAALLAAFANEIKKSNLKISTKTLYAIVLY